MSETGQPPQTSETQTTSSTSTSIITRWAAAIPGEAYSDGSIRLGFMSFPTDSKTWTALLAPTELAGLPEPFHLQIHTDLDLDPATPSDLPDNFRAIPEGPARMSVCSASRGQAHFSCDLKVSSRVERELGTDLKLDLSNVQCSIPEMNQPRTFDLHIPAGMRSFKSEPLGSAGHAFRWPMLDHNGAPTSTMGTTIALIPSSWEAGFYLGTVLDSISNQGPAPPLSGNQDH